MFFSNARGASLCTTHNFLGEIVTGYDPEITHLFISTKTTADVLCSIQNELNQKNLGLYVWDAYRPLQAVAHFAKWGKEPIANPEQKRRKEMHYPHLEKE